MIFKDFSIVNRQEAYNLDRERPSDNIRSLKLRVFMIIWRKIAKFHEI